VDPCAEGFISETHRVDTDTAFRLLRQYARSHQLPLAELARTVVTRKTVLPAADSE